MRLKNFCQNKIIFLEKNIILLFLIFTLSRIFYYNFFDINFDTWTIDVYWQYFPKNLLKNHLLTSVFYDHHQPPLLNLIVGISMKLTKDFLFYLQAIYLFSGFLSSLFIYLICLNFNISKNLSFLVAAFLLILPTTILYENHLYKDHLTFFFLTWLFYFSFKIYNQNNSLFDVINFIKFVLTFYNKRNFSYILGIYFLIFFLKKLV